MVHRASSRAAALVALLGAALNAPTGLAAQADTLRPAPAAWAGALVAAHERLASDASTGPRARMSAWLELAKTYPIECDWMQQDGAPDCGLWLGTPRLGAEAHALSARIAGEAPGATLEEALARYASACALRRVERLRLVAETAPRMLFTKHYTMGGSHYAYTEAVSDAINERTFAPGSALCLLTVGSDSCAIEPLLDDPYGVIRDPDVSYDGARALFSWKRADREDDYHLYEMDLASRTVRVLTSGLGLADYEGAYLPDGRILFSSTRCVQAVDCWWTEVSNLYSCDANGASIQRVTYDQVHDNYPTVTDDGRVLYTRWEYSDRGQLFPQPLFTMNADGTGQTEFYGNNSWFPTTVLHARGIPGSSRVLAIATGHHSRQVGKLIVLDPAKGRQEAEGAQLIAPVRPTEAERIDAYGQDGDLAQYPYPLTDREFLVTYHPTGWLVPGVPGWEYGQYASMEPRFGIYWMDVDGRRELLAADPDLPCSQPVPVRPRRTPLLPPSQVDETQSTGTYVLQDVYQGPGLAGVPRGTVRSLRVVALEYRPAAIRSNGNEGAAGGALVSTPVSIGNGAWDVKRVLGEVPVAADGSAAFRVPARTPVYFQALDADGHTVQTMRSWSTLQPGERMSCVGCHEPKNAVPPAAARPFPEVQVADVTPDAPGFSFAREVQPILDRHCVSCHSDRSRPRPALRPAVEQPSPDGPGPAFSLLAATTIEEQAGRAWSDAYLALTRATLGEPGYLWAIPGPFLSWVDAQSIPPMLPPYYAGAARSGLLAMLRAGHGDVALTEAELRTVACWIDLGIPFCGDYREASVWSDEETAWYDKMLAKRAQAGVTR